MEFVLGLIIIVIILLILGIQWYVIVAGLFWLIGLLLVVMVGFFIVTGILCLIAKPERGTLLRIMQHEVVGTYAIYDIGGTEYKNLFPAEILFVNQIYHPGREYPLRIQRKKNGKYLLFDWYTWIIIGAGLVLSVLSLLGLGWLLLNIGLPV